MCPSESRTRTQASGSQAPGRLRVDDQPPALDAVELTADEATAVAVALVALTDGPLDAEARTALQKVLTALGPAGQDRVTEVASRVWTRPAGLPRSPATPVIEDAMRDGFAVALDYVDAAGRASHRRVEPHAFAYARGNWYLLTWCLDKDAPRWFRWDRITRAEPTTIPVQRREAFSVFPAPSPRS